MSIHVHFFLDCPLPTPHPTFSPIQCFCLLFTHSVNQCNPSLLEMSSDNYFRIQVGRCTQSFWPDQQGPDRPRVLPLTVLAGRVTVPGVGRGFRRTTQIPPPGPDTRLLAIYRGCSEAGFGILKSLHFYRWSGTSLCGGWGAPGFGLASRIKSNESKSTSSKTP